MKKLNLLFVILILCLNAQSQVSQILDSSMFGGKIRGYAKNSSCVLVATEGGIFKTTNFGQNWTNATQNFDPSSVSCRQIVSLNTNFFAMPDNSKDQSIYKSTDNGTNWTSVSLNNWWPQSLGKASNLLFAVGGNFNGGNIYTSTDGNTWTERVQIWNSMWQGGNVQLMSFNQNRIFMVYNNYLIYTSDGINLDTVLTDGLSTSNIGDRTDNIGGDALGNLYFNDESALYKYNFTSKSWADITTGKITTGFMIMDISVTDNLIFINALNQSLGIRLYKSANQGGTFTEITNSGVTVPMIGNIIEVATNKFVGNGFNEELLFSSNGGDTWAHNANQFIATYAGNLIRSGNALLFSKEITGIIRSGNQGVSWGKGNSGIPGYSGMAYFVNELAEVKDTLFAFGRPDPFSDNVDLYKSVNNGASWFVAPIPAPYINGEEHRFAGRSDSALFVSYYNPPTEDYALLVTFNNGKTWTKPSSQNTNGPIFMRGPKNCIFAFNLQGQNSWNDFSDIYKSNNYGASFTNINPSNLFNDNFLIKRLRSENGDRGGAMMDFDAPNGKAIFAVNDRNSNNIDKLYLYTISSGNWSLLVTTGLPSNYVANCIKFIGNNSWLLATNLGLYKSTNNGVNWVMAHPANLWQKGILVNSIQILGNKVFLGTESNGVWMVDMTTGMLKPYQSHVLQIFPNPGRDIVNIKLPYSGVSIANVMVYGINGQILLNTNVSSPQFQLNLSNWNKGSYVIVVNTKGEIYRQIIIKE